MKPKDASVDLSKVHPELGASDRVIERTRREALEWCMNQDLIVTSAAEGHPGDGVHSRHSLHYPENCPGGLGLARDYRILDFVQRWALLLEQELGATGRDFVIEPGATLKVTCPCGCRHEFEVRIPTPHLHDERDPKKRPLDPFGRSASGPGGDG